MRKHALKERFQNDKSRHRSKQIELAETVGNACQLWGNEKILDLIFSGPWENHASMVILL